MSPGNDETRVCGYIRSEFIYRAFWRTLMITEYILFVHHTTSILGKLSTRCFEHSGYISCSLLVNPSQSLLENIDENRIFFVRSPHHKHFGKAQHSGDISCSPLVNPSHTDESARFCRQHILVNIYIYIDQNFILFLCLKQQSKIYFGDGVYGMSKS